MNPLVTRIAPSPTGDMHLGTARTALFNYLAARQSGGFFIVRIDDTDLDRNKEDCVNVVYDTMKWLGLDFDQTFRQSERTERYTDVINRLLDTSYAVYLDNGAVALTWDDSFPLEWDDTLAGRIPITPTNIEQIHGRLILSRGGDRLGQPTYQLCSVVDDYDYGINHIIRGVDHQSNTPKQIAIWKAIGDKPLPTFTHVGLIFKDKKKLSKRDDAASLLWYRDHGYLPEALLAHMLRLGWAPKEDNKENSLLLMDRALKMFLTEGSMRNSNANHDAAKLDWINKNISSR